MPRLGLAVAFLVFVAGIVWVMVFETLFGAILVLAGVGALVVLALPAAIEWVARVLSTGSVRRH